MRRISRDNRKGEMSTKSHVDTLALLTQTGPERARKSAVIWRKGSKTSWHFERRTWHISQSRKCFWKKLSETGNKTFMTTGNQKPKSEFTNRRTESMPQDKEKFGKQEDTKNRLGFQCFQSKATNYPALRKDYNLYKNTPTLSFEKTRPHQGSKS